MLEYDYQALNAEGQSITGRIAAQSAALATAELEGQGLTVQSLQQVEIAEPVQAIVTPVSQDACDQVLIERLDQLIAQREMLVPALAAFAAELPAGRPRRELRKLASLLSDGASAEQIVRDSDLAILLPLVGDDVMRGTHRSLDNLLSESAQRNRTRTMRVRTLIYPMIVIATALVVLMFLAAAVVPSFSDIYDDFDLDLPELTVLLVKFSNELLNHPLRLLTVIVLVGAACYYTIRFLTSWGLPGRVFRLLTTGSSSQLSALSIFARTMAEALGAGFSLSCSLRMAGQCSNQQWVRIEADRLAASAENDWCLSESATSEARLPTTLSYALRAGPSGAPSLPLLREVAELYAERIRNRFDWSTGFMPQFMILLVGIVVFGVVMALYLPLVYLINGLTG
ncbi:type II secretion system F family protein [Bythopirellula polymerisocia]|uniref:Type II secretion system protein F n=1 Tax=Bythopirellula polymerisocia TaxID=2528003 RepID=A0A5C6CWW6_9BACT|nr:type II secretion system F family protein [Bythopirellula polymerisocia]TWU28057.1 Type II secretion system protein F [Bythopirellula polymerisocia]